MAVFTNPPYVPCLPLALLPGYTEEVPGKLRRLLFSDMFACLRQIPFLPFLDVTVLLAGLLYMNKLVY